MSNLELYSFFLILIRMGRINTPKIVLIMYSVMKNLTIILIFLSPFVLSAQEIEIESAPTETPQPAIKEFHQIFLNEPVQKINKLEYSEDGKGPLNYKLSDDGSAIHLLDYDGSGGVTAEVTDMNGNVKDITKSKCHIHSLPEL